MYQSTPLHPKDSEDERTCRICLEEGGQDLIAPCRCSGTQRWVHRHCLDRWRSTQQDRAFSKCTECNFQYRLASIRDDDENQKWKQIRIQFFIMRDSCLVFLVMNIFIGLLGLGIRYFDTKETLLSFSSQGCFIQSNAPLFCQHILAAYYLWGFLSFLVLLGLIGLLCYCINECQLPNLGLGYGRVQTCDCLSCYYCGDCVWSCTAFHANGAGVCCDLGSLAGAGEGLIIIVLMMLVILAIIGLFIGVLISVAIWQKLVQRHMRILQKRELAKEFIVMDLSDIEKGEDYPPNFSIQRPDQPGSVEDGTSHLPNLNSQPNLSHQDSNELARLGLL